MGECYSADGTPGVRMDTGKAIVAGAIIIAATGALTAWAIQPRYSLTNPGWGVTVRLDRAGGDMIGCERLTCRSIVVNGKPTAPNPFDKFDGNER